MHYDKTSDAASCFCCHKAEQECKLKSTTGDLSFISKCFINWKDVTEVFIKKDKKSKCHQDASQAMTVLTATISNIGESCSTAYAHQKSENRSMLLKILQNIHFWASSITLRGHDDSKCDFMQLLNLQAAKIVEWFDKYTSYTK